jgi:hypothetical protein
MFVSFASDVNATYATIKPQPSRASLRKKRIKKDIKGYVDLLFTVELARGAYVKEANLKIISDSFYSASCNIELTILDSQKQSIYGQFVINNSTVWHIGETVTFGDKNFIEAEGDSDLVPFASAINSMLLMPSYEGLISFYVRVTFDRENFYTWDRGFFIRPEDYAPVLELETTDYIITSQPLYMCVEDTIPPPYIQGLYLFSSYSIIGSRGLYFYSIALDTRDIHILSYDSFRNDRGIYIKSSAVGTTYTPPAPLINYGYSTQREIFWTFISGDLTSSRTLYFPLTDAIESKFFINDYIGSDDFTLQEILIPTKAFQTLDNFFDGEGKDTIDDLDTLYLDGTFKNTLIFNQTLKASSPSSPILVTSFEEANTIIYGHLANEGTSCVANVIYDNLTFMPSSAISTTTGSSTVDMLSLKMCDTAALSSDPYVILGFNNCKFFIDKLFENNISSLLKVAVTPMKEAPLILTFDTCLFGIDGPGDLEYLIDIDRFNYTTIYFRNCSFLNPYNKTNGAVKFLRNRGSNYVDAKITVANCIFWNIQYQYSGIPQVEFLRCYNGNPQLESTVIGNPLFGKLKVTSPCYRKWLPRYGQNIGWDQTIPEAYRYYNCNITALGNKQHIVYTNISSRFDVRDKYITNIAASFVKLPYIMDTRIIATYAEVILKLTTDIPVVKTSILRLPTIFTGSFPISTDVWVTEILLLKYPIFNTHMVSIKETYTPKLKHRIEADRDYECPIVMRYGIPEWYDPILGTKLYYYFDIYDRGSGVNISSLSIEFQGTTYSYGEPQIKIQPLTVDKTAYRILFYPNIELSSDSEYDIFITVEDCSKNKGPIWDNRRADEVLNWGGLTAGQERLAMIPCLFSINWSRTKKYTETFERFNPPVHIREWVLLYRDTLAEIDTSITDFLFEDTIEDDFDPYYTILWEKFLSDFEPGYTAYWDNLLTDDIEVSYLFPVELLFSEIDPSVTINYTNLVLSDDLEVSMSVVWQHKFTEEYQNSESMLVRCYIDTFNWVYSTTWINIFGENYQTPSKIWEYFTLEDFEWWTAYYDIIFIGDLWIIETDWQQLFNEIEVPMQYSNVSLYTEDGEWWLPYQEIVMEYKLYSDKLEYVVPIEWGKWYSTDFDYAFTWYKKLTEYYEWCPSIVYSSLYFDNNEWYPEFTLPNLLFSDGFNVSQSVEMLDNFYIDDIEWLDAVYDMWFIDNNETEFLPYQEIIWSSDIIFTDTYIEGSINWTLTDIFIDTFEQTIHYFNTEVKYIEGYERLGILSYALQTVYLFELVNWNSYIYNEDFEYLSLFNYFVPFIENYEWSPIIENYELSLIENMELNIVWDILFVDSVES